MKNNKILNPIGINIDANMDADDLGQRVVDVVKQIDPSYKVVNLVKVHIGEHIPAEQVGYAMKMLKEVFDEQKCKNCIFVPIGHGIDDITIDKIEVTKNDE